MKKVLFIVIINLFLLVGLELLGLIGLLFIKPWGQVRPLIPHPCLVRQIQGPGSIWEPDPNTTWWAPVYRFGTPRKLPPPKKPGEFRVFLLGGSTIEGDGAGSQEETIAQRLEFHLNSQKADKNRNFKVFNEGYSSYCSKEELLTLATKILPFQEPDIVIAIDGVNDFLNFTRPRNKTGHPFEDFWTWKEYQRVSLVKTSMAPSGAFLNAFSQMVLWGVDHTYFGQLANQLCFQTSSTRVPENLKMRLSGYVSLDKAQPVAPIVIDYYLKNIKMMEALTEAFGAKFFWVLQPVIIYNKSLSHEDRKKYEVMTPNFREHYQAFFDQVRAKMVDLGTNSKHLDFSPLLNGRAGVDFIDYCHYSPAAQDFIAQKLVEEIAW